MKIIENISKAIKQNLPFVAYKKPNEHTLAAFFQQNNELYYSKKYDEKGFVFAPFNNKYPSILIPLSQSEFLQENVNFSVNTSLEVSFSSEGKSDELYKETVNKAIKKIVNKEFKKVVLSRKECLDVSNFDVVKTFKKLVKTYPKAMVYVWFHPKVGLWLGATPETLLRIEGDSFETASLAGTQVYKGTTEVVWQPKEIEEQQLVTDYILSKLQPICRNVVASKTETIRAGSLLHLYTRISGKFSEKKKELITCLHPTPAVCGFPKEISKKFILNHENYNREFYTGFLGELNINNISNLFVNLRCMQIQENKAIIYVGGGIVKDSNSQKEWEETVAKTEIMKRVL